MLKNVLRKLLPLAISICAAILIPLVGWGLGGRREYFATPARTSLILVVLLGGVAAPLLDLDLNPLHAGRSRLGRQSATLFVLTLASVGLIWFLPFADRREILTFHDNGLWRWMGLLLCSIGILVRLAALTKLGKQFSAYVTLQDDHELVQSGIYAVIRHPLYLSLLLAGPGFALVFHSVLVWPILAVTMAFVSRRIRQEEQLLMAEFGKSFEEYRSRTWALIPLIL